MMEKLITTKKRGKRSITPEFASKILREVPQNYAFYFFTDDGQYIGMYATSLVCFCNKLKTIDSKSIDFHFKRGDFEKWIRITIGDATLANKVRRIKESVESKEYRTEIHQIVEQRISQLKKLSASEDAHIEHF